MVDDQVRHHAESLRSCTHCGRKLVTKGHYNSTLRSVYGKVRMLAIRYIFCSRTIRRPVASWSNVTLADVYFGRWEKIFNQREEQKQATLDRRVRYSLGRPCNQPRVNWAPNFRLRPLTSCSSAPLKTCDFGTSRMSRRRISESVRCAPRLECPFDTPLIRLDCSPLL